MSVTLDTRKPIDCLTVEDFGAFPIWEFAMDEEDIPGRDETWVRPVDSGVIPLDAYALSVACKFSGPSGREFAGFVVMSTDMPQAAPNGAVLLYGGRYISLSLGSEGARLKTSKQLELPVAEVFPLSYEVRVRVDGEQAGRRGTLE